MAMVSEFLVSKLRETLLDVANEESAKQNGLADEIGMLQGTLEKLQFYLQDAERKSIDDASTNLWLCKIKDVVYDIEDVLDEHSLEVGGGFSDTEINTSSTEPLRSSKVCCSFPILSCLKKGASGNRTGAQIEDLTNKLQKIMEQIPRLKLIRDYNSSSGKAADKQLAADMSRSIVVRPDVVGSRIILDARNLVGSLIIEDRYGDPLVYSIVGTGGIGKSTLARLVFENSSIKNHFDLMLWVAISQDRDELDILRTVVESSSKKDERGRSMALLQEKFKEKMSGKKVLLVLDDVREVEKVWDRLFKSLIKSTTARCSCKVLVTTRSKEVAVKMKTVFLLQMEPLPLEDGWLLLRKAVVSDLERRGAGDDEWGLRDLGIEFVKKCNGLPLAINVVGGILSAKSRTREAWTSVLEDSTWEVKALPADIHRALYMGYHYLPLHVKQCFLYCSFNPNDVLLKALISLEHWIQEGFIKDENNLSQNTVGESYMKLLVRRNLLAIDPKCFDGTIFMMHELCRSLCRFLMQHESLVANEEELLSIKPTARKMKLRRLSFLGGGSKTTEVLKFQQKYSSLRSLLIFDQSITGIGEDLFNHLLRLRMLHLERIRITELPASIGALGLLQYLNLARTFITELPETIGNLRNLRVLIVAECLKLSKLPPCIMNLHRLCFLTTFNSATSHLPLGLRRLHDLRILEFSLPAESETGNSSSLEDLDALTHLRELTLQKLERVLDVSKARSVALKEKQLESLHLGCSTTGLETREVTKRLEEVFEELCPPSPLMVLVIVNYFGSKFPSWVSPAPLHSFYTNLKFIQLVNCSNIKQVPAFGLLPGLEGLRIEGATEVEFIGPEFYLEIMKNNHENTEGVAISSAFDTLSPPFPKLKLFYIENMENLEEWKSPGRGMPTMTGLEVLHIGFCPKLKKLPDDLLCHSKILKKLIIEKSEKVQIEMEHNFPHLEIQIFH